MSIEVKGLTKTFAGSPVVRDVSFKVDQGDLAAILGPSGAGKSTLLRTIGGLEAPDRGRVLQGGNDITGLPTGRRNVGFVFQHYGLFRHMTVWENVAFGLKVRKVPKARIEARVKELLALVQLKDLERRYPSQLSGGQRQRVAMARALAPEPRLLLLDEPFGALDAKVREELRSWLCQLHEHNRVTTLFVTHDQNDALLAANRIIVMRDGRVEQEGTPQEIFDRPATEFVAQFVGESNQVECEAREPGVARWGELRLTVGSLPAGRKARVYFRPTDVRVSPQPADGHAPARVVRTKFKGYSIELLLDVGGDKPIAAHVPRETVQNGGFAAGGMVHVAVAVLHVFPAD